MDKNDFKKLDVERAQLAVSVQEARDLVTQWLGPDFAEDEANASPVATMTSSTAGLGFKTDKPTQPSHNKALERLKRTHKESINTKSKPIKPEPRKPEPQAGSDSDSETESRTSSIKQQKRSGMSALDAYKQSKKKKRN